MQIPRLPATIQETAAGDSARLARLIARTRPSGSRSVGMQQSVECAEMAPFMNPPQLRDAALTISPALRQAAIDQFGDIFDRCRIWSVPPANARAKQPLRSDTPVLILGGAFDPATPPSSARWTAAAFTRPHLFIFPDSGHGVLRSSACAREAIGAFLEDPEASPRIPCLGRLSTPVFAAPANTP